jgi:hypothetical protein
VYPDPRDYDVPVRDRVYGRATSSSEGRRSIGVVLLAVSTFLLVISLSCRQATAPGPARNVLEAGIVPLTDIDQFLADNGPSLRQAALESERQELEVPGYPLDIVLTRDEIVSSSDAQLRAIILERSSALLYAEGIQAFDRTGEQSIRRVSVQGVLELGISQVSESTHSRATLLALVALLGCALSGAVVAATGSGWARMRSLGFAAAAGSLPIVITFVLLRLFVGQIGDDDPFVAGYRDITNAALGVPLRNASIVLIAGVALVAGSVILSRVERVLSPPSAGPVEDDY